MLLALQTRRYKNHITNPFKSDAKLLHEKFCPYLLEFLFGELLVVV
tara:strand:- start:23510 stop:23647 length:138 start_codon:yes stop_codon:yes gene_type:complete